MDDAVLVALGHWLDPQAFSLELEDWFGGGKSNEPVGLVARVYDNNDVNLAVLKFFHENARRRISNLREAWRLSGVFRRHLAKAEDETDDLHDWRAVFMVLAGEGLQRVKPLSDLIGSPDFSELCGTITRSIVHDWNPGEPHHRPQATVGAVLGEMLQRRGEEAKTWLRNRGDVDFNSGDVPIRSPLRSGFLTNPYSLVIGEHAARQVRQLLTGKAHGDLNGRNILVPRGKSAGQGLYYLIDYDRFGTDAPLARDPMHLLVSLTLDGRAMPNDRELWSAAADALVKPEADCVEARLAILHGASRAVHESTIPLQGTGLHDPWLGQCLIALTGAALVHLGRKIDDEAKEWCLYLAARAAEEWVHLFGRTPSPPAMHQPVVDNLQAVRDKHKLLDRDEDLRDLRARLTGGPWGVTTLQGNRGIGKTKLVHAALEAIEDNGLAPQPPRIHRHPIDMAGKLDAKTLVDYLQDTASEQEPSGGSTAVRLEVVLESLGDTPVVIAVDGAEDLTDPTTGQLTDPDLDEVLETLATGDDHKVTVLLVSRHRLASPWKGTWPTAEDSIELGKFPPAELREYLKRLDHDGLCNPDELADDDWNKLYRSLQGNPRLAELAHAVVTVTNTGDLSTLTDKLRKQGNKNVHDFLTRRLINGLQDARKLVVEALAALGTAVPASAVVELVPEVPPAEVMRALKVLTTHRVIYNVDKDSYRVPKHYARLLLEPKTDAIRSLYFRAASQLNHLHEPDPSSVKELRIHFAEITALLNADEHASAYGMISLTHDVLVQWNCAHLLLSQREQVRDNLQDPFKEMSNHNALGRIYQWMDDDRAAAEYQAALALANQLRLPERSIKIYTNVGTLYWSRNSTDEAISYYEHARELAVKVDDPMALMGALEGIARCLRRRGRYEQAVETAEAALVLPDHPRFPATDQAKTDAATRRVTISLWLARCYSELERSADAERMVNAALVIATNRPNDWLMASCLDGQADLFFDLGRFEEARTAAVEAVTRAQKMRNEAVLQQARTTLAMIYLSTGQPEEALLEIDRLQRLRRRHRSLFVQALHALAAHRQEDDAEALIRFHDLFEETTARTNRDPADFTAWNVRGFALCGLHLHRRDGLEDAVASFHQAQALTPPSRVLAGRISFLVTQLHEDEKLRAALDALG